MNIIRLAAATAAVVSPLVLAVALAWGWPLAIVSALPYVVILAATRRGPGASVAALAAGLAVVLGLEGLLVAVVHWGGLFAVLLILPTYLVQMIAAGLAAVVALLLARRPPEPAEKVCKGCGGFFVGHAEAELCPPCCAARDRQTATEAAAKFRSRFERLPPLDP